MERDFELLQETKGAKEISIHALRMERDAVPAAVAKGEAISIHALRMERDLCWPRSIAPFHRISIHALRMERDESEVLRVLLEK